MPNHVDMSDEIIFKKCEISCHDIKQTSVEGSEEAELDILDLDLGTNLAEPHAVELNCNDQNFEEAILNRNSFKSGTIPKKIFSKSSSMLKFIGWINDKWFNSSPNFFSTADDSKIENQDEHLIGMYCITLIYIYIYIYKPDFLFYVSITKL